MTGGLIEIAEAAINWRRADWNVHMIERVNIREYGASEYYVDATLARRTLDAAKERLWKMLDDIIQLRGPAVATPRFELSEEERAYADYLFGAALDKGDTDADRIL